MQEKKRRAMGCRTPGIIARMSHPAKLANGQSVHHNVRELVLDVVLVVTMFSGGKIEKVPAKLKSSASRFTSDHKLIMGILIGGALAWFALDSSGCIEGVASDAGGAGGAQGRKL